MEGLYEFLERIPKNLALAGGFLFAAVIGVAYFLTGSQLALYIFFVVPVFQVTWAVGNRAGIMVAVFSAIIWFIADLLGSWYTNFYIPLINVIIGFIASIGFIFTLELFRRVLQRERECSHEDPLTGTPNMHEFFLMAEREIMRARRKVSPITVAYLGIDDFEKVNERYGEKTGSIILHKLANSLLDFTRSTDVSARIREKDFVLLLPETDIEGGIKGIRRIREMLTEIIEEYEWPIQFSVGLVTYNILPENVDEMIKTADELQNEAKDIATDRIQHQVIDY
jgi:diguanylate cyclase (GGDEF)-like protein